jgi:hypothetical protein
MTTRTSGSIKPARPATAYAAATLALVMGAIYAIGLVGLALPIVDSGSSAAAWRDGVGLVLFFSAATLLLLGAILLLRRKSSGRLVVTAGAMIPIAVVVLRVILRGLQTYAAPTLELVVVVNVVLCVVVTALALAPSTARWIEAEGTAQ